MGTRSLILVNRGSAQTIVPVERLHGTYGTATLRQRWSCRRRTFGLWPEGSGAGGATVRCWHSHHPGGGLHTRGVLPHYQLMRAELRVQHPLSTGIGKTRPVIVRPLAEPGMAQKTNHLATRKKKIDRLQICRTQLNDPESIQNAHSRENELIPFSRE